MQAAVSESIAVARVCLDTRISPAPEVLQREAASLLLALAQRMPSDVFRTYPAVHSLTQDAMALSAPLPLAVQERLFQCVSLVILPNTGRAAGEDAAGASAYATFLRPLLSALQDAHEKVSRGEPLKHPSLIGVRRAGRVFRCLCTLYSRCVERGGL